MKLRIMSDLHLEFQTLNTSFDLPVEGNEKEQTLILAGDIAPINKNLIGDFIQDMCDRFERIVMIAGNHEYYYKGSVLNSNSILKEYEADYSNFQFLQNEVLLLDDVIIMGATMWTDLNDSNPLDMNNAQCGMNDFVHIKYDKQPFVAANWVAENLITRDFLWDTLDAFKDDKRKKIVISHHLPSFKSISDRFYDLRSAAVNYAYASDNMDEWIKMTDLWIHGHTHVSMDYEHENCRVVCNPRGYVNYEENVLFNPRLIIDTKEIE